MSGTVTTLHGGPVPKSVEVVDSLVSDLEQLLEGARAGRIVAIVAAVQHHNDEAGFLIRGRTKPTTLLGALELAKHKLIAGFLETRD